MQYLCIRFRQLRSLITQKSAVFVQANAILEENYCGSNIPLKNIREARGFEDRGGMAATQMRKVHFFVASQFR